MRVEYEIRRRRDYDEEKGMANGRKRGRKKKKKKKGAKERGGWNNHESDFRHV